MKITSDPNKRIATLHDRGIDFADAIDVFSGGTLDFQDDRKDYAKHASLQSVICETE